MVCCTDIKTPGQCQVLRKLGKGQKGGLTCKDARAELDKGLWAVGAVLTAKETALYMHHSTGHRACKGLALRGQAGFHSRCSRELHMPSRCAAQEGVQLPKRCLWRSQMHTAGLQPTELPMGPSRVTSAAPGGGL